MKVKAVESESTPLSLEQFRATPEFRKFKGIMRRILKVSKPDLDAMVKKAKIESPRAGNPKAPGQKAKLKTATLDKSR